MRSRLRRLANPDIWLPWRVKGGYTFPHMVVLALIVFTLVLFNTFHTTAAPRPRYSCHKVPLPASISIGRAVHPLVWSCAYKGTDYVVVVVQSPPKHHANHHRRVKKHHKRSA